MPTAAVITVADEEGTGSGVEIEHGEALGANAVAFAGAEWDRYDGEHGAPFEQQSFAFTARLDGRVIGTATGWTGMGIAYLTELIVDHTLRSRGIGSSLLERFEALARTGGCRRLALRTQKDGRAQDFYQRHGWRVEAELPDWYYGETYVLMRKDLEEDV